MLIFLALVGALLTVADGRVQCYECREFGPNEDPFLPGVFKSKDLEAVNSCEDTLTSCRHNKCYSIEYYNATAEAKARVTGCLNRGWFGYHSLRAVSWYIGDRGGSDFSNWKTCGSDGCNSN